MFDIQYEVELLRYRLMDVLALECLDSEALASAYVDLGYLNCVIAHSIMIESEIYEDFLEAIEFYEGATQC